MSIYLLGIDVLALAVLVLVYVFSLLYGILRTVWTVLFIFIMGLVSMSLHACSGVWRLVTSASTCCRRKKVSVTADCLVEVHTGRHPLRILFSSKAPGLALRE